MSTLSVTDFDEKIKLFNAKKYLNLQSMTEYSLIILDVRQSQTTCLHHTLVT